MPVGDALYQEWLGHQDELVDARASSLELEFHSVLKSVLQRRNLSLAEQQKILEKVGFHSVPLWHFCREVAAAEVTELFSEDLSEFFEQFRRGG